MAKAAKKMSKAYMKSGKKTAPNAGSAKAKQQKMKAMKPKARKK